MENEKKRRTDKRLLMGEEQGLKEEKRETEIQQWKQFMF